MNASTTRSRYAAPVAVAVALHAVLFLGFNPPEPPPPSLLVPVPPEEPPPRLHIEPLTPANSADGDTEETAEAKPLVHPPSGPELPPLAPGPQDITVPLVPPPDGIVDATMTRVPPTPPDWAHGGRSDARLFRSIDLDEPPRPRFRVPPDYPYAMRSAGMEGEVWVEFIVDESGRVVAPRVTKSTHPGFEEATLRAVSKWTFEKGRSKGIVVRFRMSVPVVFSVNE